MRSRGPTSARTDQPCGDEFWSDCVERHDPAATLTGARQERWLLDGFAQSEARWDVLGQQVFFSQVESTPGPGRGVKPDAWDGYTANRDRIVAARADRAGHHLDQLGWGRLGFARRDRRCAAGDPRHSVFQQPPRLREDPHHPRRGARRLPCAAGRLAPGAPALTGASFVVADREPTLHPV
jgi:alkaline phosphatase D